MKEIVQPRVMYVKLYYWNKYNKKAKRWDAMY